VAALQIRFICRLALDVVEIVLICFNTGNFYAIEFFFFSKLHKKRMEKRVVVRVNAAVVYIVRGHVIVRGIDGGILIYPIVVITF